MKTEAEQITPDCSDKPAHAHAYRAVTSATSGHAHVIELFLYPVNGDADDGHSHTYQGHTMVSAGHFHRIIGTTGPAIPFPDGSHVHELNDRVNDEPFSFQGGSYRTETGIPRHVHAFGGATSMEIGSWPPGW